MTTGAAIPRAGSDSGSLSPSSGNEAPWTATGPTSPTNASGRSGDTVAFGPSPPPVDGDVVALGEVATGAPAVVAGAASSSSPHPASARTSMTPARRAGLDLTMAPVRGKGGR